jgi:hypothetical protein
MKTEELRRLAESDAPVLAFEFSRLEEKDWAPQHSHARGQLFALAHGLLIVEAAGGRWMFPSQRCAWIPPGCLHRARSVGRAAGSMLYFSAELCQGLPSEPRPAAPEFPGSCYRRFGRRPRGVHRIAAGPAGRHRNGVRLHPTSLPGSCEYPGSAPVQRDRHARYRGRGRDRSSAEPGVGDSAQRRHDDLRSRARA